MKVFGHPMSTCTRKVLTTLHEKGQKADFNVIEFAKGEHKAADYMTERQPFGQIPAIEDDGFRLYESRAIMRYIDETMGGTKLSPADAKGRALMEQWISVETSNFTKPAMKIIYNGLFIPMLSGKPGDPAVIDEGRKEMALPLKVMETQLAKHAFIAGENFSLADICFMPYIEYLFAAKSGDLIEQHEKVNAWWKKISARDSWKAVTAKA